MSKDSEFKLEMTPGLSFSDKRIKITAMIEKTAQRLEVLEAAAKAIQKRDAKKLN